METKFQCSSDQQVPHSIHKVQMYIRTRNTVEIRYGMVMDVVSSSHGTSADLVT
jgi:hypothetical protein